MLVFGLLPKFLIILSCTIFLTVPLVEVRAFACGIVVGKVRWIDRDTSFREGVGDTPPSTRVALYVYFGQKEESYFLISNFHLDAAQITGGEALPVGFGPQILVPSSQPLSGA